MQAGVEMAERTPERRVQRISVLIDGVRLQRGKDVVLDEFRGQVLDENGRGSRGERALGRAFQVVSLAQVGGEGDDVEMLLRAQPMKDDGCI